MRHDQFLIGDGVAFEQVRIRGRVVDHHLIDFRQPIFTAFGQLLVVHAEAPMRITRGKTAISSDFIHLIVSEDLEDGVKRIQAVVSCDLFDTLPLLNQIRR